MTDQIGKTTTICCIEKWQLSATLISAMDDALQAEYVANAVEQWLEPNPHWHYFWLFMLPAFSGIVLYFAEQIMVSSALLLDLWQL